MCQLAFALAGQEHVGEDSSIEWHSVLHTIMDKQLNSLSMQLCLELHQARIVVP